MRYATALFAVLAVSGAALTSPAQAQQLNGFETGDASGSPRNAIPWLREALEAPTGASEAGSSAAKSAPKSAPQPAPRDVFGGVFDETPREKGKARREPSSAPSPQETRAAARSLAARTRGAAASPSAVEAQPLKEVDGAAAGLISAKEAGLPIDAWKGVMAKDALKVIEALKPGPFRSANLLAIRTLTAGVAPPKDAVEQEFLKARIDALSRFGASGQAALLAASAGGGNVRLGADAAMVSGQETEVCAGLTSRPDPSLARIYCQAIGGDSLRAQLSIEASRALGRGDETTLSLLEAVSDPSAVAHLTAREKNAAPTPLRLAALRALKLPLPATFARDASMQLLPAALAEKNPPRLRLEAMERLEASGALSTKDLAQAFAKHKSAESGGVWGRVEAYRKALAAKGSKFPATVQAAVAKAPDAKRRATMARLLAPEIAKRALPASGKPPGTELTTAAMRKTLRQGGEMAAAIAVGQTAKRAAKNGAEPSPSEIALDYIAEPKWPGAWSQKRADALAKLASSGDAKASFLLSALQRLGLQAGNSDASRSTPIKPSSPQTEIDAGRAAHLALASIGRLGGFGAPADAAAPKAALDAIEAFHALGWTVEARALAVEAAEAL